MSNNSLKILLIKRGAMGDILMATPLIRQLKTKLNCTLDFLVGKSASIVLKNNPYIDYMHVLADRDLTLKGFFRFSLYLIKMRKRYDYVFILDKHWYFSLQAKLLATVTIGFRRDFLSSLFLNKSVHYYDVTRYQGLYYLDLLQISTLALANYADIALDLLITDNDKLRVQQLLKDYDINQFCIVVNSGGNNSYEKTGIRMLQKKKIIQLLQLLLPTKTVILLGGRNDTDNYNEYMKELNKFDNLFNFAGLLSIAESAYLISLAEHFYTTDCGVMHMGIAANVVTKMTAFFGPTSPTHFLPQTYLEKSRVIWNDQGIYQPAYQLKGVKNNIKYFTTLDIDTLDMK